MVVNAIDFVPANLKDLDGGKNDNFQLSDSQPYLLMIFNQLGTQPHVACDERTN